MSRLFRYTLPLFFLLFLAACNLVASESSPVGESDSAPTASEEAARPAGWSEASHSDAATPNYEVVFPQDNVNRITVTITPEDWEAMQANMTELFGERGSRRMGPGGELPEGAMPLPPDGAMPGGEIPLPEGFEPPEGAMPGGPRMGGGDLVTENPMWVAATVEFNGQIWTQVGVRYKGNSSLMSAWNDPETLKLPLKLDFDQFEDDYPEITNQRFYGFKQLSLANGFGDASFLRETLAYDLLAEAGLVSAETAYYEVILDYGEGPQSLGLYTMIEVIDDTVIVRTFGDDSGNIYEGDGRAASLAEGTAEQLEESFQKENNESEADWSDIQALYEVLHSEQRTSDPAAWRAEIEALFEVETFLDWLALSAALEHWDTYGGMSHNFYLYHNPATGKLTWISWDHNLILGAMAGGPRGGMRMEGAAPPGGGGAMEAEPVRDNFRGRENVSLDKKEVEADWPLIRYLLDDPTYYARYLDALEKASTLLDADTLTAQVQERAALIAPFAIAESDAASFETAVQALTERLTERDKAVADFLAAQ